MRTVGIGSASPPAPRRFASIAVVAAMCVCLLAPRARAQSTAAEREFRGVWVTTLGGLDWPDPALRGDERREKEALRAILDRVRDLNLNAVMFQVRSRGNAFYRSTLEPWAAELTGTLGADPGWDPLAFAVAECRARGLEIHAWFNCFKVWSGGGTPPRTAVPHVALAHPDWVRRYRDELWLDPGIPDARAWLVSVVRDLAAHYDVDGLHLDYARYPDADFDDAATYARYGGGRNREAWRRANVDAFVRDAYDAAVAARPGIQVGSAPIGIYENLPTARGWEAYSALAQDARAWMRDGYQDYAAPQIYWGLKRYGSGIDFEALVADWTAHRAGRHVYAGIAAYKPDVAAHLAAHVEACRRNGAQGECFFRYDMLAGAAEALRAVYPAPAIPPAMPWRDRVRPNPPRALSVARGASGGATLRWQPPAPAVDGDVARRTAVYRTGTDGRTVLLAVLSGDTLTWTDPRPEPDSGGGRYAVTALDRFRNESDAATAPPALAAGFLPAPSVELPDARLSHPVPAGGDLVLLGYTVDERTLVRLRIMDERGAESSILVDAVQEPGTYVVGIERDRLAKDIRWTVLEEGTRTVRLPFDVDGGRE